MNKQISEEKQKELDKLSKKYFWEQKTNEVSITILIVLGFIAALYICSSISLMIEPRGILCPSIDGGYCIGVFITGLFGLLLCIIFLAALFGIGYLIYEWIKSNQKKAEERAKDELGIKYERYSYW